VLSLSLNVLFNPLRCLTVRDLDRWILETVRGDTGECASDSTIKTDLDRANYIGNYPSTVRRVLH
jgi:hypothetical protein